MHLLIASRQGFEVIIPHPVQFQLESAGGFQVSVDSIFFEDVTGAIGEEFGELFSFQRGECDSPYAASDHVFFVAGAEVAEHFTHGRIVSVAFIFDACMEIQLLKHSKRPFFVLLQLLLAPNVGN